MKRTIVLSLIVSVCVQVSAHEITGTAEPLILVNHGNHSGSDNNNGLVVTTTATLLSADGSELLLTSPIAGSAPMEIAFEAVTGDNVAFAEWQFSSDSGFDTILLRYDGTAVVHTFLEAGTTYVRFFASDNSGRNEYVGDVYEISVSASSIKCPNAFSPGNNDGINDTWKPKCESIIDFECHIFNRWGVRIVSFKDPSIGWNGKYKGKNVSPGVYFYVIKAKGADGKEYNLKGDVNIIETKRLN